MQKKKTPVKVYVKEKENVDFEGCKVFGSGDKFSETGKTWKKSWRKTRIR